MTKTPTLRVARPSDDLEALLALYRDGFGLDVLFRFENHAGFDGIMLGGRGAPYHFEFTRPHGHAAGRAPTPDNLLVFYLPERTDGRRRSHACAKPGLHPRRRSIPIGMWTV